MIKIRAHHLICLQNFKGYGYNQEFIDNFHKILNQLEETVSIKIIASIDDICKKCPNLKDEKCQKKSDSEKKAFNMDKKVLETIKVKVNSVQNYKKLKENLFKKFKENSNHVLKICCGCQWENLCKYKL